jgi:hypothetical protein
MGPFTVRSAIDKSGKFGKEIDWIMVTSSTDKRKALVGRLPYVGGGMGFANCRLYF